MSLLCCSEIEKKLIFNTVNRTDPTRTFSLRRRFEAELFRRFKKLKNIIKEEIIDKNVFGLDITTNQNERFAFPKSSDKIQSFMDWLEETEKREILETYRIFGIKRYSDESWMNIYIRSSYQRGIARARAEMNKVGIDYVKGAIEIAFNKPFHVDAVSLLYTRAFNELKGITNEMNKQISRVLSEGFVRGDNPRKIAVDLNNRVSKIGIVRARVLARTEIIRAHHEANMNEYEQANVEGLKVYAELLTAKDSRVCVVCRDLEVRSMKRPYTIAEMKGVIPVHPNCRCVAVPFTEDFRKIKRKAI